MFRSALLLIVCLSLSAFAWADSAPVMAKFDPSFVVLNPSGEVRSPATLDDPQPDTIRYDDGGISSFYSSSNLWSRVRFTAPNNFEVRSIYFVANNPANNAAACSVFVHANNNGNLGAVLAGFRLPGNVVHFTNFSSPTWNDVNLPTPVQITSGSDFFVVIGPAPGGVQSAGWHILLDANPTSPARSHGGFAGHYGTYSAVGGDWLVRVGGQAAPFVDMTAEECYNTTTPGNVPRFNMLPGTQVTFKAQVKNVGNVNINDFTVEWVAFDPSHNTVFVNEVIGDPLARNATAQYTAGAVFTPTVLGEYMVAAIAHATGDAMATNDTTWLRMFVGGQPRWFRYDDNQNADGSTSFTPGNGWGVSFAPVTYTAAIESLRISCSTSSPAAGDVQIWRNNAAGTPDSIIWSATPILSSGWNTIPVTPPANIFAGETFTVGFIYTSIALGQDFNPPNAGAMPHMGTVAWQYEGQWSEDNSGNWCIQAYIDTSSATPPYAIIETDPADTLQFGQVDTTGNTSRTIDLVIYNRGSSNPLSVTQMSILPVTIRNVFTINPTTATIPAGSSSVIQVTFNPNAVRTYNGTLSITNNSQNAPTVTLIVRAEGVAGQAAELPGGALPTQYSLSQNFPNPFNPATEISFALPVVSDVRLAVFNVLGQEIALLAQGTHAAGVHTVTFDAAALPAGVYFYRLEAGSFSDIRKMLLLK